jgi:hypothetical protein
MNQIKSLLRHLDKKGLKFIQKKLREQRLANLTRTIAKAQPINTSLPSLPSGELIMIELKDQMLRAVGRNANKKVGELAGKFVHAAPQEKEAILAGIDFERWLADTCQESLEKTKRY